MGKGTGNPDGNAAKHMSYFGDNGWLVVNKELNISGNRFKADSKGWLTQMMKVIFMDGLGNEISTQYVEKGKKATPPENPTRSGYEFDGWDKSYNNITAYTTIIAKWKAKSTQSAAKTYTVTFKNGNSTITTQTVKAGASAKAPANPSKTGYTFAGWDKNFTNVKKDLTVNAKWDINTYKVVFTDGQGKTLKTQTVQYGKSASAPDDPIRSGYTFAGWDRSYDNVKGNLTVNAKWKENVAPAPAVKTYTVKFISEDTLLKTETVESGKAATAPPDPTRYFYSDIYNYKFVGWDKKFDKITQDTTVTALWEENKLQYKYDVKFVTQPYADTGTPVFVETDNPDPGSFSFSFLKADGSENELWLEPTRYDDLSYDTPGPGSIGTIGTLFWCDGSMAGSHGKKVPGGYFYTIRMEDPGEMIIKVTEHTTVGSSTFTIAEENIGRITVKDYYEELDKWADEVISKVSKGSNSKQEQMQAITNYLRSTAKYRKCYIDKNGNTQYLTLATEYGLPIWETNEWTSYTSPSFLCYFGDKIGYPLHNMFYDYERGTEEWSRYHMYAKSIEDGTMYEFCPTPSTNLLKDIHSEDDVKKIDFLTYNNYYRMTSIN